MSLRKAATRFRPASSAGFTLLEVMIAMAVMMVAFTSIFMVQNSSLNASSKARRMNIVSMLARNQMIDFELAFQGKPFNEVKKEEAGQFKAPYEDFSWKRTVKEVKFPDLSLGGGDDKGGAGSGGSGGSGSNQAADQVTKLLTKFLTKSVREVTVTISWKRGSGTQDYSLSQYWVDLNHEFELSE